MKIYSMREGLLEAKTRVAGILSQHDKAVALISGLPGSGKSTLYEILSETQFGGLVPPYDYDQGDEIPYDKEGGVFVKNVLAGNFPDYNSRLFIAGVAGAGEVRRVVGEDPRVFVMKLHCDRLTRFTNIARREWARLELNYDDDPLKVARSVMRQYTSHDQRERRFTDEDPDLVIDTSRSSRVGSSEIRRLIVASKT